MDISKWAFGHDMPAWPMGENGQPEQAALLHHTFDSLAEADMTISLLSAYNIPCFKYYSREGAAGKVISGFSGYGTELYVPQTMLEEAQGLLAAQPEEE